MNYYILPLIINDRREISLPLYNTEHTNAQRFIIEVPQGVHFNLFSLLKESQIKSLIPETTDYEIGGFSPAYHLEDKTLTVTFKTALKTPIIETPQEEVPETPALTYDDLDAYQKPLVEAPKPIIPTNPSIATDIGLFEQSLKLFGNHYNSGAFNILGDATQNFDQLKQASFPDLTVKMVLSIGEERFVGQFILSFAHPEQFIGLALDFGSESSQLAVKRYQAGVQYQEKKPEHENLFKNIHAYHKSLEWIPKDDQASYYQEEINTNFYKSIFFLKEDLSGDYEDIEKELFIQELDQNLKMLVSSSSRDQGYATLTENRFHQLPNLKITHKYVDIFSGLNFNITKEGYDVNVSLSEIKNKTYNSILKVIVASFLKKEFIKYSGALRKIRFILLIPNIYDYNDIRNTQLLLNKIFEDFAQHDYQGKLLAWEILTISESDASFLGYINKNDVQIAKNSDYVIIDAGKGTTDFSIIKTGQDNIFNIKPMYRNGFAGAGNMITFAIFETVIHYIRAQAKDPNQAQRFIKEQIIGNLSDTNLEIKNRFYQELERLKFNFQENQAFTMPQWQQARSGDFNFSNITETGSDINVLIHLLSQVENIADFYNYVQETCNLIAERAVSNLKIIKDNSSHFDGKGAILTGRGFMFKMLEQEFRTALSAKLNLPQAAIHTLYGNELKDVCIKGVFNHTVRLNAEKIGYPVQIIMKELSSESDPKPTEETPDKEKKSFSNRLLNIFFNELKDIEYTKAVINTEQSLEYENLAKSQILIGSKRFKVGSSSLFDNKDNQLHADILFTPQGYLIRKLEGDVVKNLLPLAEIFDESHSEMSMVVPSLFPNYIDVKHVYSLKRTDIKRAPIMPPPPSSLNNEAISKPRGPQFF